MNKRNFSEPKKDNLAIVLEKKSKSRVHQHNWTKRKFNSQEAAVCSRHAKHGSNTQPPRPYNAAFSLLGCRDLLSADCSRTNIQRKRCLCCLLACFAINRVGKIDL
jgi:hypothetical protein